MQGVEFDKGGRSSRVFIYAAKGLRFLGIPTCLPPAQIANHSVSIFSIHPGGYKK